MLQEASMAKIIRPRPHNVYLRENFFTIIDKCRKKQVIWLSAPPGTGKTTLVSSYVESRGLRCLWYQVDARDKDPATFFHYLGLATTNIKLSSRKGLLPHLTPEYRMGIQTFSKEFFSKLSNLLGKNSIIVFDNYQDVSAESVLHEIIHYGLDIMPKGINVIIISRSSAPPILSRMRLAQSMEVITWDELRLTTDEIKGIAHQRGKELSDDDIRITLAKTEGWTAGVVLMLDSPEMESVKPVDKFKPDSVFNYFADVLFNKFHQEVKDFLLKTAVLPVMTVEMAKELTGNSRAASIISYLVDMNYFVQGYENGNDQIYYQYHHLFRDFLIARLKSKTDKDEIKRIEYKAAGLLLKNGRVDDAAVLYKQLKDWNSLGVLLLKGAPLMLTQGRHKTLSEWIGSFPKLIIKKIPWLLYWKGICDLPFEQHSSRRFFEKAYQAFYAQKNPEGIFQSWCGIIEAVIYGFNNLKILDRWIALMDSLLVKYPVFPSKEIKGRVSLCMFMALSFRAPQHSKMSAWANKVYELFESISDYEQLSRISLFLVDYFLWIGDMDKADLVMDRTAKIKNQECSPMAFISLKQMEALNHWYHGRMQACMTAVTEGLRMAEKKGVNVFNYFLLGHCTIGLLTSGNIKLAEEYLKRTAAVLDKNKRLCASLYHHIVACHKLLTKDMPGALTHEKQSFMLALKVGSPFGEAMSRTGLALLYYELGAKQKAIEELLTARTIAKQTGSELVEFVSYIFESYFALDSGDRIQAVEKLKTAMSLGNRNGLVNFHMWSPDIMVRLCLLALEENIEVTYVKRLILERGLYPENPPYEIENWPWRVRIYSMRGFNILKDGTPVQFKKKAPRKMIDLLRLIIALGGKNIPESKILDALWEDAEGDAAHFAFSTILKRLRRLLGFDDAIVLRNGYLTLNLRYCWVDVMAFEYLIRLPNISPSSVLDNVSAIRLKRAIELYRSGQIIYSGENHWPVLFSERLKSMFVSAVTRLGKHLEKTGKTENAIECFNEGIRIEPFSEELYQNLLVCLQRHGYKSEASALFNSMTKIFNEVLGIDPSAETKRILKSLSL